MASLHWPNRIDGTRQAVRGKHRWIDELIRKALIIILSLFNALTGEDSDLSRWRGANRYSDGNRDKRCLATLRIDTRAGIHAYDNNDRNYIKPDLVWLSAVRGWLSGLAHVLSWCRRGSSFRRLAARRTLQRQRGDYRTGRSARRHYYTVIAVIFVVIVVGILKQWTFLILEDQLLQIGRLELLSFVDLFAQLIMLDFLAFFVVSFV